jgi:two-component system response regulator
MLPISSPWILVVEDSDNDMFLLERALEKRWQLWRARDGDQAIHALSKLLDGKGDSLPGTVVLDLNLPRVGGYEVLSFLRTHDLFDAIPVLMTTSAQVHTEMRTALSRGADAFFVKPFDLDSYGQLPSFVELARRVRLERSAARPSR